MDLQLIERQCQLFAITEEFFWRATGDSIEQFAKRGEFGEVIRSRAEILATRGFEAFSDFERQIRPFYTRTWRDVFHDAQRAAGMKLVLGGTSRFSGQQLGSVRKMLLYADTILIPDPLLPWLETERREEKFRHVNLLQQAFWLLHLKPLVDTELPYPAVLVFPSWEKGLEASDEVTRDGQVNLATAVIGQLTGHQFRDFDDLSNFARSSPAEFLRAVEKAELFLAPGAASVEPIDAGIRRYKEHINTWRSAEHVADLNSLPNRS